MDRRVSLDYLRGVMALSVMLYHYYTWYSNDHEAFSLISKLGIYAVGIFYILSGLSLSLVYVNKFDSIYSLFDYLVKRIFRIFPLFWLATSMHILFQFTNSLMSDSAIFSSNLYEVLINYTLVFGFFDPVSYIAIGAWSIGNEIVYYSLFPLIVLLFGLHRWFFYVGWFFSFLTFSYFSFIAINQDLTLASQWEVYVNPINNLFLFYSGVAVGFIFKDFYLPVKIVTFGMIVCFLSFLLVTGGTDQSYLVTNYSRMLFSFLVIFFVFFVFLSRLEFKGRVGDFIGFLGEACYSIYLLHPLISFPVIFVFSKLGLDLGFGYLCSFILTLILSYFSYRYIEKPGIALGKRVASGLQVLFVNNRVFERKE